MASNGTTNDDPTGKFVQDTQQLARDVQTIYGDIRDKRLLERYYTQNPYVVLGAAAGLGYVVAGGLFSPFTRRLVRFGMKAVFVPVAAAQLKGLTGQDGQGDFY